MTRAGRLLLQLFATWHAVAMIAFSWPESDAEERVRPLFESYRRVFGLHGMWDYFAPSSFGHKTLLVVHLPDGQTLREDLGLRHGALSPARTRLLTMLGPLDEAPTEAHVAAFVATFCAGLTPSSAVGFELVAPDELTPAEVRAGAVPWGPDTTRRTTLGPWTCP